MYIYIYIPCKKELFIFNLIPVSLHPVWCWSLRTERDG